MQDSGMYKASVGMLSSCYTSTNIFQVLPQVLEMSLDFDFTVPWLAFAVPSFNLYLRIRTNENTVSDCTIQGQGSLWLPT